MWWKYFKIFLINFQFQTFFTFALQMSAPYLFHVIQCIAGDVLKEEIRLNS